MSNAHPLYHHIKQVLQMDASPEQLEELLDLCLENELPVPLDLSVALMAQGYILPR